MNFVIDYHDAMHVHLLGVWIQWNGMVDWNVLEWWTGMEWWNGMVLR